MACCHIDTGTAIKLAHGKGKHRCRLNGTIHVGDDAIGREHACGGTHELVSSVATIARNGDAWVVVMRVEVVCEPLRGLADGIRVHAVGAKSNDATQSGRTERELTIEGIVKLLD